AAHPVDCLDDRFDALLAIDWRNVHRFADEIPIDGASLMVGDPDQGEPPEVFVKRAPRRAAVAFKKIAKAIPGAWPNMVMVGVAGALAGLPADALKSVLRKSYKKTAEGLAATLAAVDAGYAAAAGLPAVPRPAAPPRAGSPRWLISGN